MKEGEGKGSGRVHGYSLRIWEEMSKFGRRNERQRGPNTLWVGEVNEKDIFHLFT